MSKQIRHCQSRGFDIAALHREVVRLHQGNCLRLDMRSLQVHHVERREHHFVELEVKQSKSKCPEKHCQQEPASHQEATQLCANLVVSQMDVLAFP